MLIPPNIYYAGIFKKTNRYPKTIFFYCIIKKNMSKYFFVKESPVWMFWKTFRTFGPANIQTG
jgi:hypothetical protein